MATSCTSRIARNNRDAANRETGEYGFEDIVNPADVNGAPNNTLDAGEDVNGNGVLDVYGQLAGERSEPALRRWRPGTRQRASLDAHHLADAWRARTGRFSSAAR